jgi:cysteine desulfurase/selenocysteine lyase
MTAIATSEVVVADRRADFPILHRPARGGVTLVYLDSAATTQKPQAVIDAVSRYYASENANIHRGVHWLSEQATEAYDAVRAQARAFLNAEHDHEVIFARGTTEAINLVATSFGQAFVRAGDEIVLSTMEHHSIIVPWQLLAERTGAVIRVIPITDEGELDLEAYARLLGPRTKLVAVAHISNSLGTVNPVRRVIEMAHAVGAAVLLDGAQSAPHLDVDVQGLDCDFFACSGHKMYGPTGIGLLYGKSRWLEAMPPYQGGGDMIAQVSFERTTYAPLPAKFEAGTPHIAGVVGLGAAISYIESVGRDAIAAHEHAVLSYATERVGALAGVRLVGTARERAGVLAFTMTGVHPHDIGTILDARGVAIRAGHHCAQPVMERFGVPATARASFGLYNNLADVDALVDGIAAVRSVFGP